MPITREQALSQLIEIKGNSAWDIEANHSLADDILCQLLISLGYQDVVDVWNEIEKWYA